MKKGILISYLILTISCNFNGEKLSQKEVNMEKSELGTFEFRDFIEIAHWDYMSTDFRHKKEFITVYNSPQKHYDSVVNALGQPNYESNQKDVFVFALQKLEDSMYYEFIDTCIDYFNRSLIRQDVLVIAIAPGKFDNPYRIIKNYKDPRVILLMEEMLESPNLSPSQKSHCEDILTGRAYEQAKAMVEGSGETW